MKTENSNEDVNFLCKDAKELQELLVLLQTIKTIKNEMEEHFMKEDVDPLSKNTEELLIKNTKRLKESTNKLDTLMKK
jgi:hypothetical protein